MIPFCFSEEVLKKYFRREVKAEFTAKLAEYAKEKREKSEGRGKLGVTKDNVMYL